MSAPSPQAQTHRDDVVAASHTYTELTLTLPAQLLGRNKRECCDCVRVAQVWIKAGGSRGAHQKQRGGVN